MSNLRVRVSKTVSRNNCCGIIPDSHGCAPTARGILDEKTGEPHNPGMDSAQPARRVVKLACPHDCPDTCGLDVTVENGKAISVKGSDMPFTTGTLCTKVARYLDRTYAPSRILYPLKRVGAKGEGRFARISWDEALDTIAARFKAIAAVDPQQILPVSYAGTMGMVSYASIDRRFFHRLGASLLERTLCSSAGKAGMKITLGGSVGCDPEQAAHSKLIIIWGSNPVISNLHFWSRCQEAKRHASVSRSRSWGGSVGARNGISSPPAGRSSMAGVFGAGSSAETPGGGGAAPPVMAARMRSGDAGRSWIQTPVAS